LDDLKHDKKMLKDKAKLKIIEAKNAERNLFDERTKKETLLKELFDKEEETKLLKLKIARLECYDQSQMTMPSE
jgi:hypothetical protein